MMYRAKFNTLMMDTILFIVMCASVECVRFVFCSRVQVQRENYYRNLRFVNGRPEAARRVPNIIRH